MKHNGTGQLQFVSVSPAGTGRKIYLPFYLINQTTGYQVMTPTGLQNTSTEHPTIRLSAPGANGATETAVLRTPQIPYALMRFVGFVTHINTPSIPSLPVMDITFSDLQMGGGANLFVQEGFTSGDLYRIGNPNPGFRDTPLIVSPNQMEVSVQGLGLTTSAATAFSCAAVCDILDDDNYGQHLSGPYAR